MITMPAHLLRGRVVSGARRTLLVLPVGAALFLAGAGPAAADVPEGWGGDAPPPVDPVHALLVLGGVPLLLLVVITAMVMLPSMVRGERSARGTSSGRVVDDQWFGGPRQGTAELPGADTEDSDAGGASARW